MDVAVERSYPTPLVNSTLLPMLLLSLARQKHTPDTSMTLNKEYDFIVVGAGSAGSVVASRLSEMPCVNVLLLEAGKPPPLLTEVPGLTGFFRQTDIDWNYKTAPQKYSGDALINKQVIWPSGKTVGGSSVLNNQVYVRGNRENYDRWAAEGAKGWSFKDVLPYFTKMEDNRDPQYLGNGFHGVDGPQTVHRPQYKAEFKHPIFQTIESMGYNVVDPNADRQTGFYDVQGTLRAGQKCSTAKAYLVPAEKRRNLDIVSNAMVRKVLIKNNQAVGVEFDLENNTYTVTAKREVILSAGTVNTVQLLMLSGIGPRKELERHKIPIIADMPVGKNLQDHSGTFVNFLFKPDIPRVTEKLANPVNIARYIQNRTGPLAASNFISVLGFLGKNFIIPKKDIPDHQLYFLELQSEVLSQIGMRPEVASSVFGPYEGRSFFACVSSLLHPRSRGTVTLQSQDPYDPPVINPNYYEDPKDIEGVVEGLKTCMRIGTHSIMQQVGSTPFATLFPGCEKHAGNEDLYFWCLAKSLVVTLNNAVGTARMGDPKDPRTVVDPLLRVLKIKGLRVVDSSVMPIIPSGNTNIPTIMVAEKASDIIKSTIKCHKKYSTEWRDEAPTWVEDDGKYKAYKGSDAFKDKKRGQKNAGLYKEKDFHSKQVKSRQLEEEEVSLLTEESSHYPVKPESPRNGKLNDEWNITDHINESNESHITDEHSVLQNDDEEQWERQGHPELPKELKNSPIQEPPNPNKNLYDLLKEAGYLGSTKEIPHYTKDLESDSYGRQEDGSGRFGKDFKQLKILLIPGYESQKLHKYLVKEIESSGLQSPHFYQTYRISDPQIKRKDQRIRVVRSVLQMQTDDHPTNSSDLNLRKEKEVKRRDGEISVWLGKVNGNPHNHQGGTNNANKKHNYESSNFEILQNLLKNGPWGKLNPRAVPWNKELLEESLLNHLSKGTLLNTQISNSNTNQNPYMGSPYNMRQPQSGQMNPTQTTVTIPQIQIPIQNPTNSTERKNFYLILHQYY